MRYDNKSLSLAIRSIFDDLGFNNYEIEIYQCSESHSIGIALRTKVSMGLCLQPEKLMNEIFTPIMNSPRYKKLIDENSELKRLLTKDEVEGINLEWE